MAYILKFTQDLVGQTVYLANEPHNGGTEELYIDEVESENIAFTTWRGQRRKLWKENNSFYTEKEEADRETESMDYNFKRSYDQWATSRF